MKWYIYLCGIFIIICMTNCTTEQERKIVFIGDSLIKNWDEEKYFPYLDTENRGVDGRKIKDCFEEIIINEEVYVVLLIGINDLSNSINIEPIIEEYTQLVDAFKVSHIFCISILPNDYISSEIIEHFNTSLKKVLQTKANVTFVDVYNEFYWQGHLNPEYTIDGTHLSSQGYELLTKKLSSLL